MKHELQYESFIVDSWKPETEGEEIEGEIFIIDLKQLKDDAVPFIELILRDGSPIQILMGAYVLQSMILSGIMAVGGYLKIRYDGLSSTIKKASNFAKLYSTQYYAPGDWSISESGEFTGTPTSLRKTVKNASLLFAGTKQVTREIPDHSILPTMVEPQTVVTMETIKPFETPQDDSPFNPDIPSVDDPTEKVGKKKR